MGLGVLMLSISFFFFYYLLPCDFRASRKLTLLIWKCHVFAGCFVKHTTSNVIARYKSFYNDHFSQTKSHQIQDFWNLVSTFVRESYIAFAGMCKIMAK